MKFISLNFKFFRKYLIFIILIITVVFSQSVILKDHLKYGFSDVDWGFLAYYKEKKELYPNIFRNIIELPRTWGIYSHQDYYIGLQSEFFGLNLKSYQLTTHKFRTLAIISTYPLFLYVTGSMSASFAGTILFAVAYPAVGTMYTVVTSSDYVAILFMNIFLLFYLFILRNNKRGLLWQLPALLLLILTLFWSTERMYPILFFILITEIFLLFFHRFSKFYLKTVLVRASILLSPLVLGAIFVSRGYSSFLFGNGGKLIHVISQGGWQNLLRPFISLGGLVMPDAFWKYLTVGKIEDFITGPFVLFTVITFSLGYSIFKKSLNFIIQMSLGTLLVGIIIILLHSEIASAPALTGGYLMLLNFFSLIHWLKYQRKERLLVSVSLGISFAFLYIILTWIASDMGETPTGAHRYLTVPALLISFALGSLIILTSKKLWQAKSFIKFLSLIPFLVLILMIIISSFEVRNFFQEQLKYGFGADDKQLMRGQLLSFLNNLSDKEPSLFYFDFNDDQNNAYYYDNTLLGGFGAWMFWHPKINFRKEVAAFPIWNRFDQLNAAKVEKNGKIGFWLNNQFYSLENFYAFKLKDKKVYNIKDDLIERLK